MSEESRNTQTESNDGWVGCLGLLLVVGLIVGYIHLDEKWFAARRPWNLFLVAVELIAMVVALVCFVIALISMYESREDKGLAKICISLAVTGLGTIITFIWGWRRVCRDDWTDYQDKEKLTSLMQCWTGALVVFWGVLGYVWFKAPPNVSVFGRLREPPITFHVAEASRNEQGRQFYQVQVWNNSDVPLTLVRWTAFPGTREFGGKKYVIEVIPPRGYYVLPHVYDRGWVFEFDCGDLGTKVLKL